MRKNLFCAVLILLSIYQPVRAEPNPEVMISIYMTGEQLTQVCRSFLMTRRTGRGTSQEWYDAATCYGYVIGVVDEATILPDEGLDLFASLAICVPKSLNGNTLTELVATFADQNPAARVGSGYAVIMRALMRSFPCTK